MAASEPGLRLRWSIVRAVLDPTLGHEQQGIRPVLIVSNEPFNQRSGRATVVPLTTARRAALSSEVLLPAGVAGLPVDSIVLVNQVRTISQERFRPPLYGRLTDRSLRRAVATRLLEHLWLDDLELLDEED